MKKMGTKIKEGNHSDVNVCSYVKQYGFSG